MAPISIKSASVSAVVAASFARIFFRNCANLGLAAIRCPEAVDAARDGSTIVIDTAGKVEVNGRPFEAPSAPPFLLELGAAGGLVEWTAARLAR